MAKDGPVAQELLARFLCFVECDANLPMARSARCQCFSHDRYTFAHMGTIDSSCLHIFDLESAESSCLIRRTFQCDAKSRTNR